MKKTILKECLLGGLLAFTLTACEKELSTNEELPLVDEAELTVITRTPDNNIQVSYPVHVYVMNSEAKCIKKETLNSADEALSLSLQAATYQVYAIAGATAWNYNLPTTANAKADDAITLKENAKQGDLMAASSTVTVSKDGNNSLTLNLSRKVMLVKNITIKEIPTTVDAVTVTISPVYKSLLLNGSYSAETESLVVALAKQADGTTWQNSEELYALPAVGKAKLTIGMTTGNETTSYEYASSQSFEANHEINITGTYTENQELLIAGTVNGTQWGAATNVEFTFNNENKTTNGGGEQDDEAPAANTWYKKCFVLSAVEDGDNVVVTLLHKDALTDIFNSDMSATDMEAAATSHLSDFDIEGITGWHLPSKAELSNLSMNVFNTDVENQGGMRIETTHTYLGKDGGTLFGFDYNSVNLSYKAADYLRPVGTLTFKKK